MTHLTVADLDKQSLSYASVFGLIEDLSLQGSEYSWCSSLFYLGIVALPPTTTPLIQCRSIGLRVPIHLPNESITISQTSRCYNVRHNLRPPQHPTKTSQYVRSVIWGGICMCLAAPHNFAGFAAVRFLLGLSEGAVSPAFVTLTSM